MVIYSDSLIYLDFDSQTDILWVKWPHLVNEPLEIARPAIDKIIETIKHFQVSKLLIDTKDTSTNIPEEDFKILAREFVLSLATSNLKKVARVIYAEPKRELRAKILLDQLAVWLTPDFQSREFTDIKSAFAWLERDEN